MNALRILLLLAVASSLACSDDDEPIPTADVDGLWIYTAGGQAPVLTACTGDIAGRSNELLCPTFSLDLVQVGEVAAGGSSASFCGQEFTATIEISGNALEGTIFMDDGDNPVESFTFVGSVSGDTGSLDPGVFRVEGLSGTCLGFGFYNAAR